MSAADGVASQERWAVRLRDRYGPCALVTGGSDGIGLAMAQCLAAAGFDLVLVARGEGRLAGTAQQLRERHGVACDTLSLDLSLPGAHSTLMQFTRAHDIGLVVAAAGFGSSGPLLDGDIEVECAMVDLNCRATLELAMGFGRRLAARGKGGLVLMSSLLGFQGVPAAANYAATKAYVQSLAEALHQELGVHGVDVLASAPGPVHSGFAARASMKMGLALQPATVARATLQALGRQAVVRPGWLSWLLEASLAPLPRLWRTKILARVMAGMVVGRAAQAME